MISLLCGGVGGSKLATGLDDAVDGDLAVIVNTADDLDFCGLRVCPDVDTVTYALAGIAQRELGWGIEGDTRNALQALDRLGAPAWFSVGDRDLATHVYRTWRLAEGEPLTAVTATIARSLGIRAHVVPMTNGRVATRLRSAGRWLDFQEYFVQRRHTDPVDEVQYVGAEAVEAPPEALAILARCEAIVLANSNPVLSILPVLAVRDLQRALERASVPRLAVSPFVGSGAVSGPADRLMHLIGEEPSAAGVARAYRGLVDGLVIDSSDRGQASRIEEMGIRVFTTSIIMRDHGDRRRLAEETLAFARSL